MARAYEQYNQYKHPNVSHEEFIKVWCEVFEEGGARIEVAERLGMTPRHVQSRADRLRRYGVKLPSFRDRLVVTDRDIDLLNTLVNARLKKKPEAESE